MPLLIIFNPASGEGRATTRLAEVKAALKAASLEATYLSIKDQSWRVAVARAIKQADPLVVAAGGDGTINAVASLLVGTNTALGVLPVGTLNHFAADAGIPANLDDAVRALTSGRDRAVDTAEVNGQLFLNNSSIGLYPSLVMQRERYAPLKKPVATFLAALETVRHRHSLPASLTIGPHIRTLRTPFIFVGNNDYELGRVGFLGRSSLNRGKISVYAVHNTSLAGLMVLAARTFFGVHHIDRVFDQYEGTRLEIRLTKPRVEVAYDGEIKTMTPPLIWQSRPASLKVRAPR